MTKRSAVYPRAEVDTTATRVMSHAGGELLVETVRASGLDGALSGGAGAVAEAARGPTTPDLGASRSTTTRAHRCEFRRSTQRFS